MADAPLDSSRRLLRRYLSLQLIQEDTIQRPPSTDPYHLSPPSPSPHRPPDDVPSSPLQHPVSIRLVERSNSDTHLHVLEATANGNVGSLPTTPLHHVALHHNYLQPPLHPRIDYLRNTNDDMELSVDSSTDEEDVGYESDYMMGKPLAHVAHAYDAPKQYKSLSFWPLPPTTALVMVATLVVSILAGFQVLKPRCSAPSFVIHHQEYGNLFMSPFWFPLTPSGVLLAMCNIITLGLFEESLTLIIGSQRRFFVMFLCVFLGVGVLRQVLGYVFSRATGWALPILFFSDSINECSYGLGPFLFAFLLVQTLSVSDRYIFYVGQQRTTRITLPKFAVQLIMCMLNFTKSNILWWSLSGILTGLFGLVFSRLLLARDERVYMTRANIPVERKDVKAVLRWIVMTFQPAVHVLAILLTFLLAFNMLYTRRVYMDTSVMNAELFPDEPYLITFIVLTAPRPGDPDFLITTINSYLEHFPEEPKRGSLYARIQFVVYTHFTKHIMFDRARRIIGETKKGQKYIRWFREEGTRRDQRMHLAKALRGASRRWRTAYVGIIEDDFPLCQGQWREFMHIIWEANQRVPGHCGIFVGTGGSGLLFRRDVALLASELLMREKKKPKDKREPPDVTLQRCIRGTHERCAAKCSHTLVTSRTLLMHHVGYNTSTSDDRVYAQDMFQCGWRQPFNGEPDVISI